MHCDSNAADLKDATENIAGLAIIESQTMAAESARAVLAQNLKMQRGIRGWSQEELGFETGLHRTFVAHVERGARNIAIDNIEKLASALGLEAWELLKPSLKVLPTPSRIKKQLTTSTLQV